MKKLILLFLVLTSCGTLGSKDPCPNFNIDCDFEEYDNHIKNCVDRDHIALCHAEAFAKYCRIER